MKNKISYLLLLLLFVISCSTHDKNENLVDNKDTSCQVASKNNVTDYYLFDSLKVKKYLDSLRILYGKYSWLDNYDFSTFVPDSIEKRRFSPIFGNEIKMIESPTDSSRVVSTFNFGDTVYVPHFFNGKIFSILSYRARLCDLCFETYNFCIGKNGQFGFIHSDNFVVYTEKVPYSNFLIIGNLTNTALISLDYSMIKVFNATTINYSENGKFLVFSSNQESTLNPPIFIYEISSCNETNIGKGYTPIFLNNDIYYSSMPEGEITNERIHRYNMLSGKENILCEIPDSLTICEYGQDGGGVGKFWVKQENGEAFLHLLLSSKDFEIETVSESYILKLNGELIKQ
jgi:hypothetical protein